MSSRHLSVRLEPATFARLDAESRRVGETRSQVAKRLLEEGLRMAAHPGIVFRSGPGGRRPGLAGGPDVWEVVRLFQESPSRDERGVQQLAELSGLTASQVQTALRYYAEYSDEIDAWLRRVDEAATEAEARWRRAQALLGS